VDIRNTNKTALHMAALNDHVDVVQLLIDSGADVTAADDAGNTPLHFAALKSVTQKPIGRSTVMEVIFDLFVGIEPFGTFRLLAVPHAVTQGFVQFQISNVVRLKW